jgi:hypothetical protein
MDRREALKKMAVGGATVVGASTVMSSVAFANPGTANCAASASVALSYSTTGNTAAITVSVTGVSCPCPPGNPSSPQVTYNLSSPALGTWLSAITSTTNVLTMPMPNNPPLGVGYPYTRSWTVLVRVRCLDRNGQPVCATFEASGTTTKTANGNNPTFTPASPPSGSVTYSPATCS